MRVDDWNAIVNSIESGNPQGTNALMLAYGRQLKAYARALAGSDEARYAMVLEDIIVDVMRQIGASNDAASPEKYIFQTATTTVRRHHQWVFREEASKRSKEPVTEKLVDVESPKPIELHFAMARLAPEERELLFLHEYMRFSIEEISDLCARSLNRIEDDLLAARQRFRYALLANRERLGFSGGEAARE